MTDAPSLPFEPVNPEPVVYKTCTKCGETKPESDFSWRKPRGGGPRVHTAACRACKIQYNRKYYAENREHLGEQNKEYRRTHAEEMKRMRRAWYEKNREVVIERSKEYAARNPEAKRRGRRLRAYGKDHEFFERVLRRQGGKCAICYVPLPDESDWHIDHDHATGQIRGILCQGCNLGLGHFKDDHERLNRAAFYLCMAVEMPLGSVKREYWESG